MHTVQKCYCHCNNGNTYSLDTANRALYNMWEWTGALNEQTALLSLSDDTDIQTPLFRKIIQFIQNWTDSVLINKLLLSYLSDWNCRGEMGTYQNLNNTVQSFLYSIAYLDITIIQYCSTVWLCTIYENRLIEMNWDIITALTVLKLCKARLIQF